MPGQIRSSIIYAATFIGVAFLLLPAAASADGNLQQTCMRSLAVLPTTINQPGFRRTEMFNPGGQHQFVVVSLDIPATDPNCLNAGYKSQGQAIVRMHSHDEPKQSIILGEFPYSLGPNEHENGGVLSQSASSTADNFTCARKEKNNPRHINRVWINFIGKVKSPAGHVLRTMRGRRNIEIEGHGYGC